MKLLVLIAMLASLAPGAGKRLIEGNPSSAVRVLIYEDLQCPDCAAFRQMMDEKLLPAYGAKVAFEHRDFPIPRHAWARQAAAAARFFEESSPELALKYRRHSLANLKETTPANFKERLAAFARDNGADEKKALAALEDPRYAAEVEADYQEGVARGVAHTPTVFVNGTPFVETFSFDEVSKAIEAALKQP
jgi:protein-disulfide isomerase